MNFAVVPNHCWFQGHQYECGLSLSCVFSGSKPLDLCNGGMVWSCCVPRGRSNSDHIDDYTDHDTYGVVNDPRKTIMQTYWTLFYKKNTLFFKRCSNFCFLSPQFRLKLPSILSHFYLIFFSVLNFCLNSVSVYAQFSLSFISVLSQLCLAALR